MLNFTTESVTFMGKQELRPDKRHDQYSPHKYWLCAEARERKTMRKDKKLSSIGKSGT